MSEYKDTGKTNLTNLDPDFIDAVAQRQQIGDEKHADNHWTEGVPVDKVLAGIKRHIAAIERGEYFDREDQGQHAAAAVCGLMYIHHYVGNHGRYRKFFTQQFAKSHDFSDPLGRPSNPEPKPPNGPYKTPGGSRRAI